MYANLALSMNSRSVTALDKNVQMLRHSVRDVASPWNVHLCVIAESVAITASHWVGSVPFHPFSFKVNSVCGAKQEPKKKCPVALKGSSTDGLVSDPDLGLARPQHRTDSGWTDSIGLEEPCPSQQRKRNRSPGTLGLVNTHGWSGYLSPHLVAIASSWIFGRKPSCRIFGLQP